MTQLKEVDKAHATRRQILYGYDDEGNCSIMDTKIGTTQSYFLNLKPTSTNRTCDAMFMVGSATDGQPVFDFYEGQRLNFYGSCKTTNGSSGIADVKVRGYYTF